MDRTTPDGADRVRRITAVVAGATLALVFVFGVGHRIKRIGDGGRWFRHGLLYGAVWLLAGALFSFTMGVLLLVDYWFWATAGIGFIAMYSVHLTTLVVDNAAPRRPKLWKWLNLVAPGIHRLRHGGPSLHASGIMWLAAASLAPWVSAIELPGTHVGDEWAFVWFWTVVYVLLASAPWWASRVQSFLVESVE